MILLCSLRPHIVAIVIRNQFNALYFNDMLLTDLAVTSSVPVHPLDP